MYPQIEKLLSKKFNRAMEHKDEETRVTIEEEVSKWGRVFSSMIRKTAEETAVKQRISTENTMKDLFVEHFAEIFKKIETPLADTIDDFFFRYM